jgi:TRAP-type C4-dicarboxylate transport system permease small subunit
VKSRISTKYIAIENIVIKIEETVLGIISFVLLATIFIQVLCRYVFKVSTPWAEEIARYSFVWLSYVGAGVAVARQVHIEINLIDTLLEYFVKKHIDKVKYYLNKAAIFGTIVFLLFFAIIYWIFFKRIFFFSQYSPAAGINMLYPMFGVFAGTILMIYHGVNRLFFSLSGNSSSQISDSGPTGVQP